MTTPSIDDLLNIDFVLAAKAIEAAKLTGTPYDLIPCTDFTPEGRLKAIYAEAQRRAPQQAVFNPYTGENGLRDGMIYLLSWGAYKPTYFSIQHGAFIMKQPRMADKLAYRGLFQHFTTPEIWNAIVDGVEGKQDPLDILNQRWEAHRTKR